MTTIEMTDVMKWNDTDCYWNVTKLLFFFQCLCYYTTEICYTVSNTKRNRKKIKITFEIFPIVSRSLSWDLVNVSVLFNIENFPVFKAQILKQILPMLGCRRVPIYTYHQTADFCREVDKVYFEGWDSRCGVYLTLKRLDFTSLGRVAVFELWNL